MCTKIIFVVTCAVLIYAGVSSILSYDEESVTKIIKTMPLPEFLKPEKRPAYKVIKTHNTYELYLGEVIQGPEEYAELTSQLKKLSESDIVIVYLNGVGGSVAGLTRLTTSLDGTKAWVLYIVDGDVYSAHAVLACGAERQNISPGVMMMFHTYSSTAALAKGSDALKYHTASTKAVKDMLTRRCSHLLTKEEIDGIINGVDVYKHF